MIRFINECGPYGPLLVILSLVVMFLVLRRFIQILSGQPADPRIVDRGLTAILFWGVFGAVLGFLGQWTAIYKVLSIVIHAEIIDPRKIVMGLRESFNSTLFGMTLMLLSGVAWFVLNALNQRRTPRER